MKKQTDGTVKRITNLTLGTGATVKVDIVSGARVLIFKPTNCSTPPKTLEELVGEILGEDTIAPEVATKTGRIVLSTAGQFELSSVQSLDEKRREWCIFRNTGPYISPMNKKVYSASAKYADLGVRAVVSSGPASDEAFDALAAKFREQASKAAAAEKKREAEKQRARTRFATAAFKRNAERFKHMHVLGKLDDGVVVASLPGGVEQQDGSANGEFEVVRYATVDVARARMTKQNSCLAREIPESGWCVNSTVFFPDGSTRTVHAFGSTLENALGTIWTGNGERVW